MPQDKYTLMTTAPVPRLIRGLAVPTIISMLVTSFYVMADTYFVGKINTQSTAAVGISFSIMAIIQAFGFFCGHGSGNFISRRLGARDYRSAEKMAATGFFSAFLIGCAIALVGLLFMDRKGENIRIHYRHFTPTPAYLKEIVYGGSPSLCRQ
ncbi:MATE family efflux transporter, partial [Phocaeicola plebeius]|uniref:MATE family efflux transporter n=1 Tax=Phocaeicola plebeius TaxID=310297 RepID=UPI003FD74344